MTAVTIPAKYICPRTRKIMREPMLAPDGLSYEKEAISSGLADYPVGTILTPISPRNSLPNIILSAEIQHFLQAHPELFKGDDVYLPVTWIYSLIDVIHNSNLQELSTLIQLDRRLLTYQIYEDYTPFHYACEFGNLETTHYLFDCFDGHYADLIQLPRPKHWQSKHLDGLLQQAYITHDFDAVELLLSLGAVPAHYYQPGVSRVSGQQNAQQTYPHELDASLSDFDDSTASSRTSGITLKLETIGTCSSPLSSDLRQPPVLPDETAPWIALIQSLIKHQKEILEEKEQLTQENCQLKRKLTEFEAEHSLKNAVPVTTHPSHTHFFKSEKRARTTYSQSIAKSLPVMTFQETLAFLDTLPSHRSSALG